MLPEFSVVDGIVTHGETMALNLDHIANEKFCHLTTTGRVTGQPRTIEIWFVVDGQPLWLYPLASENGLRRLAEQVQRAVERGVTICTCSYRGHENFRGTPG